MRRMRKWTRRGLAVACGLSLGWAAAGHWPQVWSGSVAKANAATQPGPRGFADPTPGLADEGHPGLSPRNPGMTNPSPQTRGEEAAGTAGAEQLVPATEDTRPWLRPVLWGIAGLFAAAAFIGVLIRMAGGRDPSIVATEDDHAQAADVGHVAGGGGGHDGHGH